MKKRGFGVGKWNGMGGKVEKGESIEAAAVRELEEEIGIVAFEEDLIKSAVVDFFFNDKPEWDQQVHIYLIKKWQCEPVESEEMRPQWFGTDKIPFNEMWPDDIHWLPMVLQGKLLKASFHFDATGTTILKQEVTEVTSLPSQTL